MGAYKLPESLKCTHCESINIKMHKKDTILRWIVIKCFDCRKYSHIDKYDVDQLKLKEKKK